MMKKIRPTLLMMAICLCISVNAQEIDGIIADVIESQFSGSGYDHNVSYLDFSANNIIENTNDVDISILNSNSSNTAPNTDDPNNNSIIIWGDNGSDINIDNAPLTSNLSIDIESALDTNVSFSTKQKVWKVTENGNIPTVSIKIPLEFIENNSELGKYYMFISDNEVFDTSSKFRIMTLNSNGYLETNHNFEGISYITFGFSPQISEERSIKFDGVDDFIEINETADINPSEFTISAWIKHNSETSTKASIVSKRSSNFSTGFDFSLVSNNRIKIIWKNEQAQSLVSNTSIPNNEWHHVAVTYNNSIVSIYIDGVLDTSAFKSTLIPNNESLLIGASDKNSPVQHFKGSIDEVRIWNIGLNQDQLRFIMNQEISNSNGLVSGSELPNSITKNDISSIPWSFLTAYYPMSNFTHNAVIDASGNNNDGILKNISTVDLETTPLPFTSKQNGDWNNASSWSLTDDLYIPGSASIVDPNITIDWNIVKTTHNITMSNETLPASKFQNRTILSLDIENRLAVLGDNETHSGNGLTVTHFLKLNGKLDLQGESQLIQPIDSDLEVLSNGHLERDQQGTGSEFTYNYWSSPVTKQNASVNSFKVIDVLKDGTNTENPLTINFSSSGYNGAPTSPIKIADYWIWKYANSASGNYSSWQHIRRTGTIFPGEGFTMKGPGIEDETLKQNYVFSGKPNNGDINLTLAPNNEYLVGNPYPSAIDAKQFILDNTTNASGTGPTISGTLYFWNHYGGNSHAAQNYQGGYATYNFSGEVAAVSKGSILDNNINMTAPEKPGQYIPVGQGFFVIGKNGGTINFNNGQRIYKQEEGSNSVFMRGMADNFSKSADNRMKFRIGYSSTNTINRQLLLTIDSNTTSDIDWAYDGELNETQIDDMFWLINDEEFVIQASNDAEISAIYPLGIKISSDGLNTIKIDDLENVPDNFNIYLHDKVLNLYHDLRQSDYSVFLNAGEYLNRFEVTFGSDELLGIDDHSNQSIDILYSSDINQLVLINPNQIDVTSIVLFNMLGQSVTTYNTIIKSSHSEYDVNLSAGTYIVKLATKNQSVMTKKILVK